MPESMISTAAAVFAPPPTIKKRATAAEIHAELQERIDRLAARDERFRGCAASRPRSTRARTDGAPNWTVEGFPGLPSGGFGTLVKVLDQVRMEYDLVG